MKEESEEQRLHFYTKEEVAKENVALRKELASLKEENAKLKFRADLMAIYKQEKEDRDKILHQIKCIIYDRLTETEKLNDILKFFPTALKPFSDNN